MSFLSNIFGGSSVTDGVKAIGGVLDDLVTSDEERDTANRMMEKLRQEPQMAQLAIQRVLAGHSSIFVAGGRPFITWVTGVCIGFYYIPQFAVASWIWAKLCLEQGAVMPYPVSGDGLWELTALAVGMAGWRTLEKTKGVAR